MPEAATADPPTSGSSWVKEEDIAYWATSPSREEQLRDRLVREAATLHRALAMNRSNDWRQDFERLAYSVALYRRVRERRQAAGG